jgi:hypothetical protein
MTAGTMKLFPGVKKVADEVNDLSRRSCETVATRSLSLQHQTGLAEGLGAVRRNDETLDEDMPVAVMKFPAKSLQSKMRCSADLDMTP